MGLIHLTPIIYKYYLDNKVVFNTSVNLYLPKKNEQVCHVGKQIKWREYINPVQLLLIEIV